MLLTSMADLGSWKVGSYQMSWNDWLSFMLNFSDRSNSHKQRKQEFLELCGSNCFSAFRCCLRFQPKIFSRITIGILVWKPKSFAWWPWNSTTLLTLSTKMCINHHPKCGFCKPNTDLRTIFILLCLFCPLLCILSVHSSIFFGTLPSPIYSCSLERKNLQAFCFLQIFLSGSRTT